MDIRGFAQDWFDRLSAHEPVENLLPFLATDDLEMSFPERTLRDVADFREWYTAVGAAFTDQSHVLERFDVQRTDRRVAVALVVVWTSTRREDGVRQAFRVDQRWRLIDDGEQPRIDRYAVGAMQPLEVTR